MGLPPKLVGLAVRKKLLLKDGERCSWLSALGELDSFRFMLKCIPMPDRRRPSEIEALLLWGELRWPPLRDERCDRSVEMFIGGAGAALDDLEDGVWMLFPLLLCPSMAAVGKLLRGCNGEEVEDRDGGRELRSGAIWDRDEACA